MEVTLRDVSKVFVRDGRRVEALASVTLRVRSGEFVVVLGPSGCGKSTLLRLIADQLAPTAGEVRLDGRPPSAARRRKAIAWMAQNPALLPWLTVRENVILPRRVNRRHQRPAPDVHHLLAMVGLADFADAYPAALSGGMQQRVALARTLAIGAPLWLMDEPFAALDALTREVLADEVLCLWERFRPTVLWVTHDMAEAVRLADRVVVLTARPGRVRRVVAVPLSRPRDPTEARVTALVRELRELLR